MARAIGMLATLTAVLVAAAARKLEASAYARKKVYGETKPLEG